MNHRIVWVGSDLKVHLILSPLPWQEYLSLDPLLKVPSCTLKGFPNLQVIWSVESIVFIIIILKIGLNVFCWFGVILCIDLV